MKYFLRFASGPLRDPEPNPGGNGNPPAPPPPQNPPAQPQYVTEERLRSILQEILRPAPPPVPPAPAPPAPVPPAPPVPPVPVDPSTNAELLRLRASLESLTATSTEEKRLRIESEANARKDRLTSAVTLAVNSYQFQNPRGAELFRNLVSSAAALQDDGTVIADNLPLDAYVEREIQNFTGLLAAPAANGAGLPPSAGNSRVIGYDMDNITPQKMADPVEAAKALAEIRKVGRAARYFR